MKGESRIERDRGTHQTLALHAVVDPALSCSEGEARDLLVPAAPAVLTLRAAARVRPCLAVTVQLVAGHSPLLTAALVTAVPPLRPVTVTLPLEPAVVGALSPPLTLTAVAPGTVKASGCLMACVSPGLALVDIPAGGGAVHWVVVTGVPLLAGAVVPTHFIDTDTLTPASVHRLS